MVRCLLLGMFAVRNYFVLWGWCCCLFADCVVFACVYVLRSVGVLFCGCLGRWLGLWDSDVVGCTGCLQVCFVVILCVDF